MISSSTQCKFDMCQEGNVIHVLPGRPRQSTQTPRLKKITKNTKFGMRFFLHKNATFYALFCVDNRDTHSISENP